MERAVNGKGEIAAYHYNELGYRVGRTEGKIRPESLKQQEGNLELLKQIKALKPVPEETIRYTIDLTGGCISKERQLLKWFKSEQEISDKRVEKIIEALERGTWKN